MLLQNIPVLEIHSQIMLKWEAHKSVAIVSRQKFNNKNKIAYRSDLLVDVKKLFILDVGPFWLHLTPFILGTTWARPKLVEKDATRKFHKDLKKNKEFYRAMHDTTTACVNKCIFKARVDIHVVFCWT